MLLDSSPNILLRLRKLVLFRVVHRETTSRGSAHSIHATIGTAKRIDRATYIGIGKARGRSSSGRRHRTTSGRHGTTSGRRRRTTSGRHGTASGRDRTTSGRDRTTSGGGHGSSGSRSRTGIRNLAAFGNVSKITRDLSKDGGNGGGQVVEVIWDHVHHSKVRTEFNVHKVLQIRQDGGRRDAKIGGKGDGNASV
jgi:hypothetical protein